MFLYKSISSEVHFEKKHFHENMALQAFFRSLTNNITFQIPEKGITVCAGYKSNIYNNLANLSLYKDRKVTTINMLIGTDGSEPLNHATPIPIYVKVGNKLYELQCEFHVDRFLIWEIDLETLQVTFIGYFGVDYSYLNLVYQNGYDCVFITRQGHNPNGYHQTVVKVNLETAVWSEMQITDAEYDIYNTRDYPCAVTKYGNSQYTAAGINWRKDGNIAFHANFIWLVKDNVFDKFHNVSLSHNRDVFNNGIISRTELANNYLNVGTPSDNTTKLTEVRVIQVHGTIFTIYKSQERANNFGDANYVPIKYTLQKQNIGSTLKESFEIPLDNVYDGNHDNVSTMVWNGYNLVITLKCYKTASESETRIYGINTDFTSWTYFETYSSAIIPDGQYIGIPVNLDQIPKGQKYVIFSRSIPGSGGMTTYIETTNQYRIAA